MAVLPYPAVTLRVEAPSVPPRTAVRPPRLCLPFGLPRASKYLNPGNPADLLPIVYGDFRVGGIRGPVPATLIDRGTGEAGPWVYCAAYHPVMSIDAVYVEDVSQAFALDTVDPAAAIVASLSDDFQDGELIATLTFTTQPAGRVSWRGQGLVDATGLALMENCIDQIVDLLTVWGNFDLAENFDGAALSESRARVEALGYKTAFVVLTEEVTQDWITEVLFNVMGYWRVNGQEQVEIHVDDGYTELTASDLAASILAARDCIDGDDGVAFVLDREHLLNALTAYYLYSYSLDDPSSRIVTVRDAVSAAAYGTIRKAVTLKGLRRAADVQTWGAILLARQSGRTRVEGGVLDFTIFGGRFGHLTVGDLVAFSWPYGPTREDGNPYVNEILRITTLAVDLSRGGAMKIGAVDLGIYLTSAGTRVLTPVEV